MALSARKAFEERLLRGQPRAIANLTYPVAPPKKSDFGKQDAGKKGEASRPDATGRSISSTALSPKDFICRQ